MAGARRSATERGAARGALGAYGVWIALAGLLLLHWGLAALLFDPKPFVGGDNAAYLSLAESLASGSGYRDLYLPGTLRHAQYPPVYPAMLALLMLAGGGLIAAKVLSALLTGASLVLLFLLARERVGSAAALSATLPFALSPLLLDYSHWVLSEPPFLFFTLAALWTGQRLDRDSRRWVTLCAGMAILAYLTRAAGLPLLLALLIALAWRRSWRPLAVVTGAFAVVMALWSLWARVAAHESAQVYQENFLLIDPYTPELGYVGPTDLLLRIVNNARLYIIEVLPQALAGQGSGPGPGLLPLLTALIVVALAAIGWGRSARRPGVVELFALFYTGLIFLWPQVWTDRRFLLPLLPVIFLYAIEGAMGCFEFARIRRPIWAVPAIGAFIVLLAFPEHVRAASINQRCLRFYRQGDRLACYPDAWRSFFQAAAWIERNTEDDAVVVSRKPRLMYLFSRRRGDAYPFVADDRRVLDRFDEMGADYVVVAALSATTQRYLIPVIQRHSDRFELIHQAGEPPGAAYVLRYRAETTGNMEVP